MQPLRINLEEESQKLGIISSNNINKDNERYININKSSPKLYNELPS